MWRLAFAMMLVGFSVCTPEAFAKIPSHLEQAYRTGQFEKAAAQAERMGTAEALTFAAKALIAQAIVTEGSRCVECLMRAEAHASAALRVNENEFEAHIQHAIALGFLGRALGVEEARSQGLAERARRSLHEALRRDPANPWANSALGTWHIEIVHHAGPILASIMFGASRSEGLTLCRNALATAPYELAIKYYFALSLLIMDDSDLQHEGFNLLAEMSTAHARDALERHLLRQSQIMLASKPAPREEIQRRALELQGYSKSVAH